MDNYKRHYCGVCGHEQQQVGEIADYIYCERCGAKIFADGSGEYDGSRNGIEEMEDNINRYDDYYDES